MAKLICSERYCAHRNVLSGECEYTEPIYVDEFFDTGFDDMACFSPISRNPEYSAEYWQACKDDKTGELFRRKRHGKRCEANGVVFYVERPLPDREYWYDPALNIDCTEEKSGLKFPLFRLFDVKGLKAILDISKTGTPVMELPEREETEEEKQGE